MANNKSACPIPKGSQNFDNRGSSWHTMLYISLASLGATTAISLSLIILHLRRYRAPKEQRQIIRIVFSVIAYSLVAFFELFRYEYAQYIDPLGDVYEAIGLCALFLLFIQYAAPTGTFDGATLDAVKAAEETETGFDWPKISWIFVFQYPIIEILCVALQEATEVTGRFCMNSLSPRFAHLWVEIIESFSIGACVLAIWKFRQRMRSLMKVKRGLSKLFCFKVIVFIRFTQQWVFSLFLQYHVIKTSPAFSYNDILYGIPATATCVEMVLFSLGFWYAFSSTEYSSDAQGYMKRFPIWKAVLDALNPTDIIMGIIRIFPLCTHLSRSGDWKKYRTAAREAGVQGAVRKGIRKYQNRKTLGRDQYVGSDEGINARGEDPDSSSMSGGLGYQQVYQPPGTSPPNEAKSYLLADMNAGGRPRSASQGFLMADAAPPGRPRSLSQSSLMVEADMRDERSGFHNTEDGHDRRYDQSRSPSPSRFNQTPTDGRDMV